MQEFVGQKDVVANLKVAISAAQARQEPLEHILLSGPPGLGKCINRNSIVFTEQGMIPLEQLGDLAKKGFQEKVIKVFSLNDAVKTSHFYCNGKSASFKIKTHQGFELEGTSNHPIVCLNNGKVMFKTLEEVNHGDYVAIGRAQNFFGNNIELPQFNFVKSKNNSFKYDRFVVPSTMTPELARICGYLVGDGCIGRTGEISFHNDESEILEDFQAKWSKIFSFCPKLFKPKRRCQVIRIRNLKIREFLYSIGLPYSTAKGKVVPFTIMCAPKVMVKEFLRGLFESDGHIRPNCRQMDISSASNRLIKQVQIILLNFGIIARSYEDYCKKENTCYYRLYITGEDVEIFKREIGFISKRKNKAQENFCAKTNTNKDLVPFGKDKLKEIKRIVVGISGFLDKKSYRRTARQEISSNDINACLQKVAKSFEEIAVKIKETEVLSNSRIFWDTVVVKKPSEAFTADIAVPSNHIFFANGFINHNTSLAHIITHEMGNKITATSGPAIERAGDLIGILTNLGDGDVLFIDEVHRLSKVVEEFLYPAMENYQIDFVIDKGPYAKTIKFNLKRFTLVGATTRAGLLTAPLRSRFGMFFHLDFYKPEEIMRILERSAKILNSPLNKEASLEVAQRSRGTPRVANRLLRRVRDFAQVKADGQVNKEIAACALDAQGVDKIGLDNIDRKVLMAIIDYYNGGPVGIESLAATLNEESDTIVDVVEPYLLKIGYLKRTPRGREVTELAYKHLNKPYKKEKELFR
ncbi:MAG: Holliday junction branch migration DNA helicase RuvB [Candidatus Omnitrophica bacterium]|nr:Holliday junction branch migration DNA helicase RuvB [Candidatus Omnitrophota bacterium]